MHHTVASFLPLALCLVSPVLARQIPSNILQLRDKIIKANGCSNPLGDKGFIDSDDEPTRMKQSLELLLLLLRTQTMRKSLTRSLLFQLPSTAQTNPESSI